MRQKFVNGVFRLAPDARAEPRIPSVVRQKFVNGVFRLAPDARAEPRILIG